MKFKYFDFNNTYSILFSLYFSFSLSVQSQLRYPLETFYNVSRQYIRQTLARIFADDNISRVKMPTIYGLGRQYVPRVPAYIFAGNNICRCDNICRHIGHNCEHKCFGHCINNASCTQANGTCDGGCAAGWIGVFCEKGNTPSLLEKNPFSRI